MSQGNTVNQQPKMNTQQTQQPIGQQPQQQTVNSAIPTGQFQTSDQRGPQQNHGGHEVFDGQEAITGLITVLDQYMMSRPYVKDPVLMDILDRQYNYLTDQYNRAVGAYSTGQKPSTQFHVYNMKDSHDVVYGIQPSQPKKPVQNLNEVTDMCISSNMLATVKATVSMLSMTSLEVTNPVLRRVMADSIPNFVEMAYEIFLYQNKNQYYQVPQLAGQDMNALLKAYAPSTGVNISAAATPVQAQQQRQMMH